MLNVKFNIHPADSKTGRPLITSGQYSIEKTENGKKRRYLCGISSGMDVDAHGDRMSEACIESFIKQTNDKDITLYVNHGKDYDDAIGILSKSEKTPDKEWYTEYRLFDSGDDVPQANIDKANHVWAQVNGISPYRKPRQFGFSIEGFIPENKIKNTATGKEIDYVDLDPGVSLVTKPAYQRSFAAPIAKALKAIDQSTINDIASESLSVDGKEFHSDEPPEGRTAKSILDEIIDGSRKSEDFYMQKWEIMDALHDAIDRIEESTDSREERANQINDVIDSFKNRLVPLYQNYDIVDTPDRLETPDLSEPNSELVSAKKAAELLRKTKILKCKSQIRILKQRITRGGPGMGEDVKTMLSDIIAALQQLVQMEAAEGTEGVEMQAPKNPEMEEVKSLIKSLKLLTKEEGAGAAGQDKDKAEAVIEEVQPGVDPEEVSALTEAEKQLYKMLKEKAAKSKKVSPEVKELSAEIGKLAKSFDQKLEPIVKALSDLSAGYAGAPRGGSATLADPSIAEKLEKAAAFIRGASTPTTPADIGDVRKNAGDIAAFFAARSGHNIQR